jgi:hypothetical protein
MVKLRELFDKPPRFTPEDIMGNTDYGFTVKIEIGGVPVDITLARIKNSPYPFPLFDLLFEVNEYFGMIPPDDPAYYMSEEDKHDVITQVVHFLKMAVEEIRKVSKDFYVEFYPFDDTPSRVKSYNTFFRGISRIIPGLVPISKKFSPEREHDVYLIGTEGAARAARAMAPKKEHAVVKKPSQLIPIKELLDSPRKFTKNMIKKDSFGYEVVMNVDGFELDIHTETSDYPGASFEARSIVKNLSPEIRNKIIFHSVTFAVNGELELQNFHNKDTASTILSQVKYFISDLVRPYTIFEMFPVSAHRSRLKAYDSFSRHINRFIPELEYLPGGTGAEIYFVGTKDIIAELAKIQHPQESRMREILDSPKLYRNIIRTENNFKATFKVGIHEVFIYLLEKTSPLGHMVSMIRTSQGIHHNIPVRMGQEHRKVLETYFGEDLVDMDSNCKFYDLGFTVDGSYASQKSISRLSGTSEEPLTQKEGHTILANVIYFLSEVSQGLGEESIFYVQFYPYTPGPSQIKSYRSLYNHIAKLSPGLLPVIEGFAGGFDTSTPEFTVGTKKALALFDDLKKIPLNPVTRESVVRIKELFNSNVDIEWHPENDNYLQVAYFELDNKMYVFRAMDSRREEVGIEYLRKDFDIPGSIRIWKVGFTFIDLELFPEYTMEEMRNTPLSELMYLINKNYLVGGSQAAVILTAVINVMKRLHELFPDDVISFRGTAEKSRHRVYTMLVKNTKRFVPDCIGVSYGEYYFIVPDRYVEKTPEGGNENPA